MSYFCLLGVIASIYRNYQSYSVITYIFTCFQPFLVILAISSFLKPHTAISSHGNLCQAFKESSSFSCHFHLFQPVLATPRHPQPYSAISNFFFIILAISSRFQPFPAVPDISSNCHKISYNAIHSSLF